MNYNLSQALANNTITINKAVARTMKTMSVI